MEIVIINTGQTHFLKECLNSLYSTLQKPSFDVHIVLELEYREVTLNYILAQYGSGDLLIIADDIVFTDGWYLSLQSALTKGDIIGFSMLAPGTQQILDQGSELVSIAGQITMNAINRGKSIRDVEKFDFRSCFSCTGCALYIKKEVIREIPQFSKKGMNRWGEILYHVEAKKKGFRLIVLGHHLFHHGKSTKINPDKKLSSESYLIEKIMWNKLVEQMIPSSFVERELNITLSSSFTKTLEKNEQTLFYGAGTITEYILSNLSALIHDKYAICSGLPEEKGRQFMKSEVQFYKEVDFSGYSQVIITVVQKEKEIYSLLSPYLSRQQVFFVSKSIQDENILFELVSYSN
jgi:hypothetical protein